MPQKVSQAVARGGVVSKVNLPHLAPLTLLSHFLGTMGILKEDEALG